MAYRVHSKIILKVLFIGLFLLVFTSGAVWAADEPTVIASGNCGGTGDGSNVTWALANDGVLTISGTGPMDDYKNDGPWYIYHDHIQQVVIEVGVTTIGSNAFDGCDSLTNVSIADSISNIGFRAFTNCDSLLTITIPGSVSTIGEASFMFCDSLTTPILLPGVETIEDSAFRECRSLTTITLPESLITIGDLAFCETRLSEITIPRNVAYIGIDALESSNLKSITVDGRNLVYSSMDGVLFDESLTTLIEYPNRKTGIRYLVPDGVTTIGKYAFTDCHRLTEIDISATVTYIDESAFYYSSPLTSIFVDADNPCYSDIDGVLFNKDQTHLLCYPSWREASSYIIPQGVTHIGVNAFAWNRNLSSVEMPDGIVSIDNSAFSECTNLVSINLPNSITSIGGGTFENCESLQSISLPEKITKLSDRIFVYCKSLTQVHIPENVTYIGAQAFSGCLKLTDVNIPNTVKSIELGTFSGCVALSSIIIPDSVVTIDDNAFSGCDALTSITLPSSITYIDTWAFGWCASLSTIVFEGDAPAIDGPPFDGVTATAYYPNGNPTWTDSIQERYGENLIWVNYEPDIKYHVNLTLYKTDANDPIAIIPNDKFVANVTVSRLTATEDDIAIIVFYSPEGKFSGISVFKLTEDKKQTSTLECDNSNGRLGNIKVFVIDSLFNPVPLAKGVLI